jgi:tRNA(fMet)-specific endonuclease VapC
MPGNNCLLDTNIVIEVFNGNTSIADRIDNYSDVYISTIALGELLVGMNRVTNKSKHTKKLTNFLKDCTVLYIDSTTADNYGIIFAKLYKKGKPIPTNDIWIAASAMQHDLTVITLDKHFNHIEGLSMENWHLSS